MSTTKKTCFVVMPFSETSEKHTEEYWGKHFEYFLKPLIEENQQLEAMRSKPLRQEILNEIITRLVTCSVVLVDITDLNPNVFWELGVRQSFKHGTVIIAENGTKPPFDIYAKSILFYYPNDYVENAKFTRDLKIALADCVDNPTRPDSHVLETITGRGTLFEIFCRDETLRRLDALLLEIDTNLFIIDRIYETIDNNTAKKENLTTLLRFGSASIKLLITERYLEADKSFYDSATECLGNIGIANEVLGRWDTAFEQATEKLEEIRGAFTSKLAGFKAEVQTAQRELASKIC